MSVYETIFSMAKYCLVCGAELTLVTVKLEEGGTGEVKDCPDGHCAVETGYGDEKGPLLIVEINEDFWRPLLSEKG